MKAIILGKSIEIPFDEGPKGVKLFTKEGKEVKYIPYQKLIRTEMTIIEDDLSEKTNYNYKVIRA